MTEINAYGTAANNNVTEAKESHKMQIYSW